MSTTTYTPITTAVRVNAVDKPRSSGVFDMRAAATRVLQPIRSSFSNGLATTLSYIWGQGIDNPKCQVPAPSPVPSPPPAYFAFPPSYSSSSSSITTKANNTPLYLSDFTLNKVLGSGAFGNVIHATCTLTDTTHALKVIQKDRLQRSTLTAVLDECDIMRTVSQSPAADFFLGLQAAFHDKSNFYLATPLMDGGDLQNLIYNSPNHLSTSLVRQFMAELVYAINELHKLNIVHRDLKPANIFIDKQGRLVIGDFGLSRAFGTDDTDSAPATWPIQDFNSNKTYKMCGTPGYMAPEVYLQTGYSFSVDTFALGSIFFEMLFRRYAFTGQTIDEVHGHVLFGAPHFVQESRIDSDTVDLLNSMLEKDPKKRIDLEAAMQHPYFHNVNWEKIAKRQTTFAPRARTQESHDASTAPIDIQHGSLYYTRDSFPDFAWLSPDFLKGDTTPTVETNKFKAFFKTIGRSKKQSTDKSPTTATHSTDKRKNFNLWAQDIFRVRRCVEVKTASVRNVDLLG